MFSYILQSINLDVDSSTNQPEELIELSKLIEVSQQEHEKALVTFNEINNEITQNSEQLCIIERERVKLMSELALQMQTKHDLKNKVESLKSLLESTEFDLKKYNKMKLSTVDVETFARVKKTFITYKNMLKIYFDYSNGPDAAVQKGYMYNTITKKLAYFDFNTKETSVNEISECLWKKMKLISDQNWEIVNN